MEFPSSPHRVLVVQTGEVRDVVASLPFLALLRLRLPKAEIACVANERVAPLLYGHGAIDRVITARSFWNRSYREAMFLARHLSAFDADVAFDLESSFRSGLLTWMSRARHRVGFRSASLGGRVAYTHAVSTHAFGCVTRTMALLDVFGVEGGSCSFDLPEFDHERRFATAVHRQLGLADDFVIVPVRDPSAARPTLTTPDEYTALTHFLKTQWNLPTLLLAETAAATSLTETVAAITGAASLTGVPLSLGETAALLRLATAVVGPETDHAYMAVATATPAVVAISAASFPASSRAISSTDAAAARHFESDLLFPVVSGEGRFDLAEMVRVCDDCLTTISCHRREDVVEHSTRAAA